MKRDALIHGIEQHANKIIQEIAEVHKECLALANANAKTEAAKTIDACREVLEALTTKFDSFKIYDKKYEEVWQESRDLNEKLNPVIVEFKSGLLENKSYTFESKNEEMKISEIFGNLDCLTVSNFSKLNFRKNYFL